MYMYMYRTFANHQKALRVEFSLHTKRFAPQYSNYAVSVRMWSLYVHVYTAI